MLARLVHHTDDLQRPDAPLIALVTESARTAWSPEVEHDLVGNRISQTARVRQAIGGAFAGLSGGH